MKKDLGVVQAVWPMPVLMVAAYNDDGTPNVMNAAWGMICESDRIALFLDEGHKTTKDILERKAFTVALADRAHMAEADFFGIASGNTMPDKFARSRLTARKSAYVDAPVVEEFPVVMECELCDVIKKGDFFCVVGRIANTAADESVLSANGKIDPVKVNALMFDQFQYGYYAVGEKCGQAWNAGAGLMKK